MTWTVTAEGMHYADDRGITFDIPKALLGKSREGLQSECIAEIATRNWADVDDFIAVFREALKHHKVEYNFDIELSLMLATQQAVHVAFFNIIGQRLLPDRADGPFTSAEVNRIGAEVARLLLTHREMVDEQRARRGGPGGRI